ncbi:replication protein [Bacillus cereus]|uniref:replication protein n=1 Tax=Bacillus cereus TaxID=1396 RepID=UPI000BEDDABC|nr:replication protein [Bacillus cereus]PEE33607.1 replication protein [Bacillus cereus]PET45437.1 replication protein [Bacillus cereus]PEV85985.1 replication protein [Bacillus cereus]PFA57972.1 replication protein [Bacillus cereus]PFD56206.1 replication protein [Bacillus cereus]
MSVAIRKPQEETFIDSWYECYLSERKKSGYVVTIDLSNEQHKQIWYGLRDLKHLLKASERGLKDVYLSLNAFEHGSRKTADLKQIRNIGVDLDFYKIGLSKEYVIKQLHDFVFSGSLPCPNIIMNGRGVQLVYSISGGAAPQMAYLSQYITNHFVKMLMPLGADGSCSDLSRVFRLPYSTHGKTGQQITVDLWTEREYSLQELYEYVPPLEKKRKTKRKGTLTTLPARKGVMDLYSLNTKRKADLEMIVELRNGVIENRNDLTYIYSFTTALIVKNQAATLEMTFQLNAKLADPQPKKEVERTAKNAYKDAMIFFDEFAKNDYKRIGLPHNIVKPMRNDTVIRKLNIDFTQDEKEKMSTLIDKVEKQRRDTERKRAKRRAEGVATREEYLAAENDKKQDKLSQLKEIMEANPKASQRKIAKIMGISESYVRKLKKQL